MAQAASDGLNCCYFNFFCFLFYPPPALLTMTLPAKDNSRSNHVCHNPLAQVLESHCPSTFTI